MDKHTAFNYPTVYAFIFSSTVLQSNGTWTCGIHTRSGSPQIQRDSCQTSLDSSSRAVQDKGAAWRRAKLSVYRLRKLSDLYRRNAEMVGWVVRSEAEPQRTLQRRDLGGHADRKDPSWCVGCASDVKYTRYIMLCFSDSSTAGTVGSDSEKSNFLCLSV